MLFIYYSQVSIKRASSFNSFNTILRKFSTLLALMSINDVTNYTLLFDPSLPNLSLFDPYLSSTCP